MSLHLSQAIVNTLSTQSRRIISDAGCPGLHVDLRVKGASYRARYRDKTGSFKSMTIGPTSSIQLSQARIEAKEFRRKLANNSFNKTNKNPSVDKTTFNDFVINRYLPFVRIVRRDHKTELSALKLHILPVFGQRPLAEIRKSEIVAFYHSKITEGFAVGTANRFLNHLRSIFSRAVEWEIDGLEKNPARGIKLITDNSRLERFLSPEDAQILLKSVQASRNKLLAPIIAFLLLTGCRKREALDARWENIDLDNGILTIPLSKNGRPRHVPLSAGARMVLLQARDYIRQNLGAAASKCPWVFVNLETLKPFSSIDTSWHTARSIAQLESLRIHDLRHSFASALVNSGMTLYDVKEALGHSSMATTQRYAHLAPQRLLKAVSAAQNHYQLPGLIGASSNEHP